MRRRHGIFALLLATLIWLPCLHFVYARAPNAQPLLARQLALAADDRALDAALAPARNANPEWDLMGRSFVAWALANQALREPAHSDEALRGIDHLLAGMLEIERTRGFRAFLLPYGRGAFQGGERSLFVDSEIALTCGLRRLVRDDDAEIRHACRARGAKIAETFLRAPLAESYPNEGWTFDHAVALAALRVLDHVDASDHRALIQQVLGALRERLRDPATGLLVSSFTVDGRVLDGPEGSSLWMTLHCLSLVDEKFAREQYALARRQLGASLLGFGWAREWPTSQRGDRDVDSGPVIPLLDVSAGSSGLAFVGAAAFGDRDYLRQLGSTLRFAAFPVAGGATYGASNQVGDAVLLYALSLGPAWETAR